MSERDLIKQKKQDIKRLYLHLCFTHNTLKKSEILRMILKHPAPRFYITRRSFENYLYKNSGRKNKKLEEIKTIYERLLKERTDLYKYEAIDFAINMPASSYFVSLQQLRKIINT